MVQLELDPRYLQPERFVEIDSARSQILRVRASRGTNFKSVSFDFALSTLFEKALNYFKSNPLLTEGCDLDLLASYTLKQALPFLEGKEGRFNSLRDFRGSMFGVILKHVVFDQHRRESTPPRKHGEIDNSSCKEVKRGSREGFQPPLLRLGGGQTREEQTMEQLLADLRNPDNVLGSDYLRNSPRYRRRALELRFQYPHFTSGDIVKILTLEGYQEFTKSAIRVWELRAKRAQRQKYLTGV